MNNTLADFHDNWANIISQIDIVSTNAPIGISYLASGRLSVQFSISSMVLVDDINQAYALVKHNLSALCKDEHDK